MPVSRKLLLCSCDKTQSFDPEALQTAANADQIEVVDQLCGKDMRVAAEQLAGTDEVLIACGQQAQLFERLREEIEVEAGQAAPLASIDIRDRAGWAAPSANSRRIHAKQAALVAASQLPSPMVPVKTIQSNGVC